MALMFEDQMVPEMLIDDVELSPSEVRHLAADVCLKQPLLPMKSASIEKEIMNVLESQPLTPTHWMETERDACILDLLTEDTPVFPASPTLSSTPITLKTTTNHTTEGVNATESNTNPIIPKSPLHQEKLTKMKNSKSKSNNTQDTPITPAPNSKSSIPYTTGKRTLPPTHKPARGRGRRQQLKMMTEEQKIEEAEERAAKNRLAARECRVRRKGRETQLKERVSELEAQLFESQQTVRNLQQRITELERR